MKNNENNNDTTESRINALDNSNILVISSNNDEDVHETLWKIQQQQQQQQQLIQVDGYISKRRAIGKSLCFLDLIPTTTISRQHQQEHDDNDYYGEQQFQPIQLMLRRDYYDADDFTTYLKIIQPGTFVRCIGSLQKGKGNNNDVLVVITTIKLKWMNGNPQHIRLILQNYIQKKYSNPQDIYEILPTELRRYLTTATAATDYQLEQVALKFIQQYNHPTYPPKEKMYPLLDPSKLMGSNSNQKVALLPPVPNKYLNPPPTSTTTVSTDPIMDDYHHYDSVSQLLHNTEEEEDLYQYINITGWIQTRRRFDKSITVLDIVDQIQPQPEPQGDGSSVVPPMMIWAVIHPQLFLAYNYNNSSSICQDYGFILCQDTHVTLNGKYHTSSQTLWIQKVHIQQCSWRPSVIEHLLYMKEQKSISEIEVNHALLLDGDYDSIIQNTTTPTTSSITERQWLSKQLSQRLQQKRVGNDKRQLLLSDDMTSINHKFETLRQDYPIEHVTAITTSLKNDHGSKKKKMPSDKNNSEAVDVHDGSRYQRSKEPQVAWMIHQIAQVIESHPSFHQRPLQILDIGGGKGHLSNALAQFFGPNTVQVRVIDISFGAIKNGQMRAKRQMLQNIQYRVQNATTLLSSPNDDGVDLVVGLHACGTLTDIALHYASHHRAAFVICSCCYLSNSHLPIISSGGKTIQTATDWLISANSSTTISTKEYQTLLKLAEIQGDYQMSHLATHSICSIRASAVNYYWYQAQQEKQKQYELSIAIKTMPIQYSTRNFCLVGLVQWK